MRSSKHLNLQKLDATGIGIGALMLVVGARLIDTGVPWDPANIAIYRLSGLLVGLVGVLALWATLNDAYNASGN